MGNYVCLASIWDPDFYGPPQPPERQKMFAEAVKNFKIELTKISTTMGPYDLMLEFGAPADFYASAFALACAKTWKMKTLVLPVLASSTVGSTDPGKAVAEAIGAQGPKTVRTRRSK